MAAVVYNDSALQQRLARVERELATMGSGNPLTAAAHTKHGKMMPVTTRTEIANPAPLGLLGFAFTTALLQGAIAALTEGPGTEQLAYSWAFFYGGLAQLLAGMWEIRRNNIFAGTAFGTYGSFWMGFALYGTLGLAGVYTAPSANGLQMALGIWAAITVFFFVASMALNLCLMVLFALLTVTFILLSIGVEHTTVNKVGGWFGLVTAAVAFYIAFAELVNETWEKAVFPLFPVKKRTHKEQDPVGVDYQSNAGNAQFAGQHDNQYNV